MQATQYQDVMTYWLIRSGSTVHVIAEGLSAILSDGRQPWKLSEASGRSVSLRLNSMRVRAWAEHSVAQAPAQPDWRLLPKSARGDRTGS
jgi:hypothetical protein